MNRKRQNNQQVLALEPKDRGEAPACGDGETEPFMAKSATENSAFTEQLMAEGATERTSKERGSVLKGTKEAPALMG